MPASPALRDVALDDKYALDAGRVFLTGSQALVRLLLLMLKAMLHTTRTSTAIFFSLFATRRPDRPEALKSCARD